MADEPISDSEKVKIASNLILHAPPGEFNEVFNDVRIIIDNDTLLKEGASWSFAQYNKDQFTPCKLEGASEQVLITEHGEVSPNVFIDPRTKQSFRYDHLRKEASDADVIEPNTSEPWRSALEKAMSEYVKEHYQHGVVTVYGSVADGNITLIACTESHKFEPHNFWNGRWRSQWSVTFPETGGNAELVGILKVQVHYYEDGNVQLVSSKEAREQVTVSSESKLAKDVCKLILEAEQEYQQAISDNYREMSGTTFKALRRQLPVTRSKVDWNKIAGYGMVNALKMP